jgi:type IV pilus assembly protein PilQ
MRKSAAEWGKWVAMLAGTFLATGAWAADLNALQNLQVEKTTDGARVLVEGSRAPTFTVFRLGEPDRLVVDLSSADASGISGHHDGAGPVSGVVAKQFADDKSSVGRVLVALDHAAGYDVHAVGNQVVIAVQNEKAAAKAEEKPAAASAPEAKVEAAPAKTVIAAAPAANSDEPKVVEADARAVSHPAHAITQIATRGHQLTLTSDGALAKYELLELNDPPRLALDVYGVALKAHAHDTQLTGVKELRAGAHPDKVRLVLDLAEAGLSHHVQFTAHGLSLTLGEQAPAIAKAAKAEPAKVAVAPASEKSDDAAEAEIDGQKVALSETAPLPVKEVKAVAKRAVEVEDIKFSDRADGGEVAMKLSGDAAWKLERPDGQSAVVTLDAAKLPKRLERSLDTSSLDTPVKMVSAFAVPGDAQKVRLVVSAASALDAQIVKTDAGLTLKLSSALAKPEVVAVNQETAAAATDAVTYAVEGQAKGGHYVGQRVNFEFKDIDIHNLIRIIAEISKRNIVVADDVSGKVTIRLRNVPWDEALELILRSKGLGQERIGNIIRVAPLKTLETEAASRAARQKAMHDNAPLEVQLIPVNFATGADMSSRVKEVLSDRGTVSVDARTNVLIVRDVGPNVQRARELVQALDTQTPEVLIESRIVEANTTFARQIGVQWGGFGQLATATGNATGLAFPNTVRVGGGSPTGTAPTNGISDTPNFAVNLPAAVGAGSGGAIGFVFGSAGGALQLNLRLSALENEGVVKTISAPKVTTLDNVTARISQGVQIPYSQTSAAGVNTAFQQAVLQLEVTPHITQSGAVLMNIHAENSQPDPSNTGANGQPAIQKKEAQTQVLVNDNDTTVIGGIYVRRGASATAMVPFLGRLPLLGFFFRSNTETESRQELLIFITPRIVNRQAIPTHL